MRSAVSNSLLTSPSPVATDLRRRLAFWLISIRICRALLTWPRIVLFSFQQRLVFLLLRRSAVVVTDPLSLSVLTVWAFRPLRPQVPYALRIALDR